jgi:predicted nucleic acid-binding protein
MTKSTCKPPINVFIDTNILLSFYHLTNDSLEELKKLNVLVKNGRIRLLLPRHVVHEFHRNRAGKIAGARKILENHRLNQDFPRICMGYAEYDAIRKSMTAYEKAHSELLDKLDKDIAVGGLKADKIVKGLFRDADKPRQISKTIRKAKLRHELGDPPGAKDSLGDALIWETLLQVVAPKQDLYFVSGDKHFCSPLSEKAFCEFLRDEWAKAKSSRIVFFKTLSGFFGSEFPEIKVADDYEVSVLINNLEVSGNFSSVHAAISELADIRALNDVQANATLSAMVTNSQIYWILGDDDVYELATCLVRDHKGKLNQQNLDLLKSLMEQFGPCFEVHLDYETSTRAGAGGMFQVVSIEDGRGKDRTSLVDQGIHFPDLEALRRYLAKKMGVDYSEVRLREV